MLQDFETVIGLEVHAQMLSRTKFFCGCSTDFGRPPNTQVCPVCLGLPGALPVPNREVVRMAIMAGLTLGCEVRHLSRFARKNYFYPDLAKGYQISQFDEPLNEWGSLTIETEEGVKKVGVRRIHLEEDAAKNLHGTGMMDATLVDFNRAGVPLIEIVSEPDLRSGAEAEAYLKRLREVLIFLGINDGNLEEGSFRCDANVSVRPRGETKLGTRVELKNINSFRFVRKAISYEATRQVALITQGQAVVQETRTWNDARGESLPMRGKEEAHDYRYFPDPDLTPLVISDEDLAKIKASLPQTSDAIRAHWVSDWGLTDYDAQVLTGHPQVAGYFSKLATTLMDQSAGAETQPVIGKRAANFMQTELLRHVRTDGLSAKFPVTTDALADLLVLVGQKKVNGKMAKDLFAEMITTGKNPSTLLESKGWVQLDDTSEIETQVQQLIAANPQQAAKYRAGKTQMLGFFVGQVMKATSGRANPQVVNEVVLRLLEAPN